MKKRTIIAICMLFVILQVPQMMVFATQEEQTTANTQESTAFTFDRPVKIGYYTSFTDFADDLDSLNNKGYGVEVFEKIAEVSDLEFEYVPLQGDATVALQNGEVDLLATNTKSPERAERFLFSVNPISKTYASLLSKDMEAPYADFDYLDGKTVATYEDNIANERLNYLAENLGFSVEYVYGEVYDYSDFEADFILGHSSYHNIEMLNNVLDVGVYNTYLITTFENQELMDKIDVIFYDIVVTEGNFFMELEEKYIAQNTEITHRGLMPHEIKTLQQRPLEVGYIEGYEPISFTNEQGEPDGAMVETLSYFAEQYDFEVNYHPYSLDDPPEEHANFDMLVTLYGDGDHEWENYTPTEPYYIMPMYAQVHADLYEQADTRLNIFDNPTKIGVLPYQAMDLGSFTNHFTLVEFVYYDTFDELLDAFATREVDMTLSTESGITYAQLYLEGVDSVALRTDTEVLMQYLVNHDIANEYLPIINVLLDQLPESEYMAILQNNADDYLPDYEASVLDFARDRWYIVVISVLTVLLLFGGYRGLTRREKQKAIETAYNTDALTGLPSHKRFVAHAREILKTATKGEYELISFDIDLFRTINSYYSVERGTQVIKAVAGALEKAFEGSSAIYSRRTAERFEILRRKGERGAPSEIYNAYIEPAIREIIGERYNLSSSFGWIVIDDPKEEFMDIISHSDMARMAGKDQHHTTYIEFDRDMRKKNDEILNITYRMEQAIEDREFKVYYQPKVDFRSLEVGGAEALVRWFPKLGDPIYPDQFIGIFENNGFISTLDLYVVDEVCKFISTNRGKMNVPVISVNLSAHTVMESGIVSSIIKILDRYDVDRDEVELEITESAIIGSEEQFIAKIKQFKKAGFTVSIDDFGAGVSSLNRLSAIDADVLKLDKAFFNLREQGSKSTIVVQDVINMAKHLNMKIVAEGVETYSQVVWLRSLECDYAQGYYFAKPMPEGDFANLLRDNIACELIG